MWRRGSSSGSGIFALMTLLLLVGVVLATEVYGCEEAPFLSIYGVHVKLTWTQNIIFSQSINQNFFICYTVQNYKE